jgi:hypothetical protein
MTKRQRRALEALVEGVVTIRRIAHGGSVSERTLATRIETQNFDIWLRRSAKRLLSYVFAALRRTLRSPNAPWQAKAWAVETILRLNARYPDLIIEIVTDRRLGTPSRTVVELCEVPRGTRRLVRSALRERRTHGPPAL